MAETTPKMTQPVYWRLDLTEDEFVALFTLLDVGEEYVPVEMCGALQEIYTRVHKVHSDHRGSRE
jgi:hypothetical protein